MTGRPTQQIEEELASLRDALDMFAGAPFGSPWWAEAATGIIMDLGEAEARRLENEIHDGQVDIPAD